MFAQVRCAAVIAGGSEGKVICVDLFDFVLRVSSKHIYHCCFDVLKEVGAIHADTLPYFPPCALHLCEFIAVCLMH